MQDRQPQDHAVRGQHQLRRRIDPRHVMRDWHVGTFPRGDAYDEGAGVRLTIDVFDMRVVPEIHTLIAGRGRLKVHQIDADDADRASTPEPFGPATTVILCLTERQRDVAGLLMQGLSNKAIGRALDLSHFTVRNHLSQIMRQLGVSSRDAVRRRLADLSLNTISPGAPSR